MTTAQTRKERRAAGRRDTDHNVPCPPLEDHILLERNLLTELTEIKEHLAELPLIKITLGEMSEILTVFNNAKGFLKVGKWVTIFLLGLVAFVSSMAGATAAIKAWILK